MSSPMVALVPLASVTTAPATNGFTGSSGEYWAANQVAQVQTQQVMEAEKARIRLRKRQRLFTWIYNALAICELVYFIVGLYIVEWQVADLEDNPLLGPGQEGIIKMGGTHTQRIIGRRQYWRLISTLFHSAGAIHLTANMGMVWAFGHLLVRELSPWLVALVFLAGGLAGVMVSVNVGAEHSTAGGSIPAFALAGAGGAMLVYRWRKYSCHWASALTVGLTLGVNAFIGATPFVDNSGNTAALVFGAVLCVGFLMLQRKRAGKGGEMVVYGAAVAAVAVVLAAIVGGLAGLQLDTPIAGCCNPWVCTRSKWWNCDASRIWPHTCTLSFGNGVNGTATLTCPQGGSVGVSDVIVGNQGAVQALCDSVCFSGASAVSSGGGGSSGMGGTSQ